MGKTIRTEITVETERVLILNRRFPPISGWCEVCHDRAAMITVDQAAKITGAPALEIYRLVMSGTLHFLETIDSPLLICVNTLIHQNQNPEAQSKLDEQPQANESKDKAIRYFK